MAVTPPSSLVALAAVTATSHLSHRLLGRWAARARRGYLLVRVVGLVAVLVAALAGAAEGETLAGTVGVPEWATFVAFLAFAAAVLVGGRRLCHRADDDAADRVGARTLADAYERAAEAADVDLDGGRLVEWLLIRPTPGHRIDRLRDRATGTGETEG